MEPGEEPADDRGLAEARLYVSSKSLLSLAAVIKPTAVIIWSVRQRFAPHRDFPSASRMAAVSMPTVVDGLLYGIPSSLRLANCLSARTSASATPVMRSSKSSFLEPPPIVVRPDSGQSRLHLMPVTHRVKVLFVQHQPKLETRIRPCDSHASISTKANRLVEAVVFIPIKYRPDLILVLERVSSAAGQ